MSEISRDDFEVKKVKDFFRKTKIMIRGNAPKQLALTKGDTQEKQIKNENFSKYWDPIDRVLGYIILDLRSFSIVN